MTEQWCITCVPPPGPLVGGCGQRWFTERGDSFPNGRLHRLIYRCIMWSKWPPALSYYHEHTDEYRRDVLPPCLASPLLLCYHIIDGEPGGLCACLTSIWFEERGWDFKPCKKYAGLFLENLFMKVAVPPPQKTAPLNTTLFVWHSRSSEGPRVCPTLEANDTEAKSIELEENSVALFYVSRRELLLHPALIGQAGSQLPGNRMRPCWQTAANEAGWRECAAENGYPISFLMPHTSRGTATHRYMTVHLPQGSESGAWVQSCLRQSPPPPPSAYPSSADD